MPDADDSLDETPPPVATILEGPFAAVLRDLLGRLRRAARSGPDATVRAVLDDAWRMREDPAYARIMHDAVQALLADTDAIFLLTEAGVLTDEGLLAGVLRRISSRVVPPPVRHADLADVLGELLTSADEAWLEAVDVATLRRWIEAVREGGALREDPAEPASAIVILATRVAGAAVDARLVERVPTLEQWDSAYLALSRAAHRFAEDLAAGADVSGARREALAVLARCAAQVEALRDAKKELGTNLDLSSRSLRVQQQLRRLELLLRVGEPGETGDDALAALVRDLLLAQARRYHAGRFVRQKLDLLAYLAVGHAAKKGSKYVVRRASEYRAFLARSAWGGVLVGVFACLKIHLSHEGLPPVVQALVYGLNYAVCFALIFLLGATLATKQPAMTASRLAHALEPGHRGESFALLVRAIWRSQFISFVGNIAGAAACAALLAALFEASTGVPLVGDAEARKLAAELHPWRSGSLYYAAVAGVMLSFVGFFAGYVDNFVVFHRLAERVASGRGWLRLLPARLRRPMAARIDSDLGALSGNVVLGFLLGSAGTIGAITGLPLDIRHIAFASGHATLAITEVEALQTVEAIAGLLAAVLLVGLVNFVVSFGLTLAVAIESRKVAGVDWRLELRALGRLAMRQPLRFFLPLGDDPDPPPGQ